MLPFELIYGTFGPFGTTIIAFLVFRGFFRLKRNLRIPTLLLLFVFACVPQVTDHLYLFAIFELSVLGSNLGKNIVRLRNGRTRQ